MESLSNKVILITGASTGIGAHTAKMLARFKPRLALVARSTDKLKDVQSQCQQAGCAQGHVITVTADLGQHDELSRVIEVTVAAFGQLDVLVNNAAAFVFNDALSTTAQGFDRTMAVNIRAPFFLSQAAMPHLKKTKGCIINISSIAAQRPFTQAAVYSISKAALEHFTRNLAMEVAASGVRVNAITVGGTKTNTEAEMRKQLGIPEVDPDLFGKVQPLGGYCSMEDISKVVTFLASDLSAAMTGTCLPVDRGWLLGLPSLPDHVTAQTNNIGDLNPIATEQQLRALAQARQEGHETS